MRGDECLSSGRGIESCPLGDTRPETGEVKKRKVDRGEVDVRSVSSQWIGMSKIVCWYTELNLGDVEERKRNCGELS